MYDRFTDRARKIMRLAVQEARSYQHENVGSEHILLGLIREGSGVAANVLKNLELDLERIRLEVEKIVERGPDVVAAGTLTLTSRAQKIVERAMEEARSLNHNYVGTEHLLLAVLRQHAGTASQVLTNLGFELEDIRVEVLSLLGHDIDVESSDRSRGQKARAAQSPKNVPGIRETLFDCERQLQQPQFCHDRAAVERLLADEFREFGGSGRVWDKQAILELLGERGEFADYRCSMTEFQATLLTDGVALVTYRSKSHGATDEKTTESLRSSIWIERHGRWQMLFHQDTGVPAGES